MKKIIYLITLFALGQWLSAQTISDSSYYPLDVGNVWYYVLEPLPNELFLRVKVTKDTIMENNLSYKVIERYYLSENRGPYFRYERIDSNGCTFKYDTLLKKDLFMENCNDSVNSVFQSYRRDQSSNLAFIYGKWSQYSSLLNRNIDCAALVFKLQYDEDGYYNFGKGIGLVYIHTPPAVPSILCGAIIKGKEYGNINTVNVITELPYSIELFQNYPNPFNPDTKITYKLEKRSSIELTVYDALGKEIKKIENTTKNPGSYTVTWNGKDSNGLRVSSGVYFYSLKVNNYTSTKKMILLR